MAVSWPLSYSQDLYQIAKFHGPPPHSTVNLICVFLKKTFLLLCMVQTKCILMMSKEGSTKVENFITPGAGVLVLRSGQISHLVKGHYFFKNLLYSYAQIIQTQYIVMMTKEGSNQIVTFMTYGPGTGVLLLGHGHISYIVKQ